MHFAFLQQRAYSLGASAALILPPQALVLEERFARLCAGPPSCPSYGLAPSCPPHAMPVAALRQRLHNAVALLAFKLDIPFSELLGPERLAHGKTIHCMAARLEQQAKNHGWHDSLGLGAGSCKELFCGKKEHCQLLTDQTACPYHHQARMSLSGVGVNFTALAQEAGWPFAPISGQKAMDSEAMGLMAGLVIVAPKKNAA